MKKKPELGAAGKQLLKELEADFELEGCMPAVMELCTVVDRLTEVRERLKADGIMLGATKRHPLCDTEVKLTAQFISLWRCIGLDQSGEAKRPPGRPPESERRHA